MHLTPTDQLAAGAAALVAGVVNALAGGGTLISFPALVAIGVPAVAANVTNTVSLLPGYLAGAWAQRDDLRPQLAAARTLTAVSAVGGLAGSVLLVLLPAAAFRIVVPYLILLACGLLAFGDRLRPRPRAGTDPTPGAPASPAGAPAPPEAPQADRHPPDRHPLAFSATIFLGAAYGGFFGAGLGIMLLALLGIFRTEPLRQLNALKQALSFVINLVAAVFFLFSGKVVWGLVPVMAVGSLLGGYVGGRLARVIDSGLLRRLVVAAGVAVAVGFWVG